MKTKILLLGANGQLGSEIKNYFTTSAYQILPLAHQNLDITQADMVAETVRLLKPELVINAAAYTKVDKAEEEIELAYAVNREGAENLARTCAMFKIPLLHISTDYVFDGNKKSAYVEDDVANPLSVYGKSKWEGEEKIRKTLAEHFILRVSWVYSVYGQNFVKTMIRLAREREELKIVNDQQGCPTATLAITHVLAAVIAKVLAKEAHWGTYHFCNGPVTTWYEFTKAIVELAQSYETLKVKNILPITTAEYPTKAVRPKNSELSCQKLIKDYGIVPEAWPVLLSTVIKGLY